MSPLEQEIAQLKQKIADGEQEIANLYQDIHELKRERDSTPVEHRRDKLLEAITAVRATIAARATNLHDWDHRLSKLEDDQRRAMRNQPKLIKSRSRSTPRSRSSSISSPDKKQSGYSSGEVFSRGSSSRSTPKSPGSSGQHTPYSHYPALTIGNVIDEEPEDHEIRRYYVKLKKIQKKKHLDKYSVQCTNGIITVSRSSSNSSHRISAIQLRTAVDVRNLYMLFALCDREHILSNLIQQNYDLCIDQPS